MPVLLFAIIFLWTPPHFWALALFMKSDYARPNVPMLPHVAGEAATRRQILLYAVLTALTGLLPVVFGFSRPMPRRPGKRRIRACVLQLEKEPGSLVSLQG